MSENGEIYTVGKKFTLPPAVTALTNFTSANVHFFYFTFSSNAGSVKTGPKDEEEFEKEIVESHC